MAAHSRLLPAATVRRPRPTPAAARLPWWALALPAAAFALLLVAAGGGHPAAAAGQPLTGLVLHLRALLPHGLAVR